MPTSDEPIAQIGQTLELDETDDGDAVIRNSDTGVEITLADVVELLALEADTLAVGSAPEDDEEVIRKLEHDEHLDDTDNPHATTLEQARDKDNQLGGTVDLDGNDLENADTITPDDETVTVDGTVSADKPDAGTHLTTKEYVDGVAQGIKYRPSVIERRSDPPEDPDDGDRYLILDEPTDEWEGHADEIAEWDGDEDEWAFEDPVEGWAVWVQDEDLLYTYHDDQWVVFGSTLDHGVLQGLSDDDHDQYLHRDGRRPMDGDLNLDGNALESAGAIANDGPYTEGVNDLGVVSGAVDVDVSEHVAFELTLEDNVDLSIIGGGEANPGEAIAVLIEQDGTEEYEITWPDVEWDLDQDVPDDPEPGELLEVVIRSYDGGSTWLATAAGRFEL